MRYLVGFVLLLALVASPLSVSAQAGEEEATPENLEEPVSAPARGGEVPDIETLSQTAIEDFEIRYESQGEQKKKHEQRQRRIRIAVPIVVVVVVSLAVVTAIGASWGGSSNPD
jgi:flagellar basal body-associated protein FliL